MFEDRVPMPELKDSIASGRGPDDLTIITRHAAWRKVDKAGSRYAREYRTNWSLAAARTNIDAALLRKVQWGLAALVGEVESGLTFLLNKQTMILHGLTGAVGRIFEAPSY